MRRLLLPVLTACLVTGPAMAEWTYSTQTDGVFGETRYLASTEARGRGTLWISCYHHVRSDEWRLGVGLRLTHLDDGASLPPGPVAASWRFDGGAANRGTWEALRHGGLIVDDDAALLAGIRTAHTLALNVGGTEASFDLSGKEDALARVEADCARENGARQ